MMYSIFQDKSDDCVRKDVLNISLNRTENISVLWRFRDTRLDVVWDLGRHYVIFFLVLKTCLKVDWCNFR